MGKGLTTNDLDNPGNNSLDTTWANGDPDMQVAWVTWTPGEDGLHGSIMSYGVAPDRLADAIADAEFQWEAEQAFGALAH